MSVSFEIKAASGTYTASIRSDVLDDVVAKSDGDTVVICDQYFTQQLRDRGVKAIEVEALEANKSLDVVPRFVTLLRESGASRSTKLIAMGGGIVQDLTCFIASVYMRGLQWDYIPTTLLAMVDSCVGGKSSINVGSYKNLVGTVHPPRLIVIDPAFCETLSVDQKVAGLAEAAKICFTRSDDAFEAFMAINPTIDSSTSLLSDVIGLSLASKQWFIEVDEFDRNERLLLNYGHTFGHAIESASRFRICHGVAVGLGMLAAGTMGRLQGRTYTSGGLTEVLEQYIDNLLRAVPDLPQAVGEMSIDDLMRAFRADKKHTRDVFALILAKNDGGAARVMVPRSDQTEKHLVETFVVMKERFKS